MGVLVEITGFNVAVVSYAAFLLLYTAYSKTTKKLDFQLLLKSCNPINLNNFMDQQNKVLALNGLTLLGLAFCPIGIFQRIRHELIMQCGYHILIHFFLSLYIFYGKNKFP